MAYRILCQAPLNGGFKTKPGDNDTSKSHNPWFIITDCVEGLTWREWSRIAFGREPGCGRLTLHLKVHGHTKFNLNFHNLALRWVSRASQLHGHGPWPQCKVALQSWAPREKWTIEFLCTKHDTNSYDTKRIILDENYIYEACCICFMEIKGRALLVM